MSNLAFKDPNHHKNEMVIIMMPTTSFVFIIWLYFSSSGFPVSYIENIFKQLHKICLSKVQYIWVEVMFSHPLTVPVALPEETESDMMISHRRVAPGGFN